MRVYQQAKVQHYWLVDPENKTFECFAWHDGVYALVASGMDEDVVEHPDFAGLSVNLRLHGSAVTKLKHKILLDVSLI